MSGIQVVAKLRETLRRSIPAIILTGDISTGTSGKIALLRCVQLNKPVKLIELTQAIQHLLPTPTPTSVPTPASTPHAVEAASSQGAAVIFVVDDDRGVREAIRSVLEDDNRIVEDFASCEAFLETYRHGRQACLVIDAYLPGMGGLELLRRLRDMGADLPAIMITGNSDVAIAVQAMKSGASDFIEKPISRDELLASVGRALEQ
jgi:two-component system CheB/CheR fusion protein